MPDKELISPAALSAVQSINQLESFFSDLRKHSFGMPLNQDKIDLQELGLSGLALHTINNLGDPYKEGCYQIQSKAYEREVIDYISSLYEMDEDGWGYVTNCGSEGNLFSIYLGREVLRDRSKNLFPGYRREPLLIFSDASHYSMPKAARVLDMQSSVIKTNENGEMDYASFESVVMQHPLQPILVVLNMGTTLTGAMDSFDEVKRVLDKYNVQNYFIHCDAALSGMMIPFMGKPLPVSFKKGLDSMVISAHKFLGSPIPSGMVVTHKHYADQINQSIEVIGSTDITMGGSRYGLPAIVIWYIFQKKKDTLKQEVMQCLDNANYLNDLLQNNGYESFINNASVTVVLKKPRSSELINKYQLAVVGDWAHVVVLQHVSRELIEEFVDDLLRGEALENEKQCQDKQA